LTVSISEHNSERSHCHTVFNYEMCFLGSISYHENDPPGGSCRKFITLEKQVLT